MAGEKEGVAIFGVFVADLAFWAGRLPEIGETLVGSGFAMGPGGKGSNQSVAAARLGAKVTFITKVGADAFGDIALATWQREGVIAQVTRSQTERTGAAFIYVNDKTGENAIIVATGAGGTLTPADVDMAAEAIRGARVFVTQLEQPVAAARQGLAIAKAAGVSTVFNPAPALRVADDVYPLCDYVVPNETEAAALTGVKLASLDDARRAGDALLAKGAGTALITLGEKGALFHGYDRSILVPAVNAGPVVETTGAGDAFVGGFATALARGSDPVEATRFGCAVAGLSVTRAGTAPSMPTLAEVEALMARASG
ncbi:MAG TPA: ribokinase [Dongiaceae bacterium]|jgi:ribokinase|nr:ribokinase [Dongiaceae bacterium]